ncbi:hypothetical protein GCM10010431_71960 [Streptomyces kunmingensis]
MGAGVVRPAGHLWMWMRMRMRGRDGRGGPRVGYGGAGQARWAADRLRRCRADAVGYGGADGRGACSPTLADPHVGADPHVDAEDPAPGGLPPEARTRRPGPGSPDPEARRPGPGGSDPEARTRRPGGPDREARTR